MTRVNEDIRREYRNAVLQQRLKAGYKTQRAFAERVGISPSTLCDIESNRLFLSSTHALRIRDVLNCSLDELYEKKKAS